MSDEGLTFWPALYQDRFERVKELIEQGANVNDFYEQETPLHRAVHNRNVKMVQYLIEKGADVNRKGFNDMTPLHQAADSSYEAPELVRILVKAGADVNARNTFGETPLRTLLLYGDPKAIEVLRILVQAGADINAVDDREGKTLLHKHVHASPDEVAAILRLGADKNIRDKAGRTARQDAAAGGYMQVANML